MFARKLCIALLALLAIAGQAMASQITVVSAVGDVQDTPAGGKAVMVTGGASLPANSVLTTGNDSRVLVKFEDGQIIVLTSNSSTKIGDYYYNAAKPEDGHSSVQFLSGAMRFITGLIGKANPKNVGLSTQQATIGIRGTTIDLTNGSVTVDSGSISITNAAGDTVTLGTGGNVGVLANGTFTQVPIASLNVATQAAYASLQATVNSLAAIMTSAGLTTLSATVGTALGATLSSAVAAAVAAAAAIASKDNNPADHSTATHH